jgi:hypothetical protein
VRARKKTTEPKMAPAMTATWDEEESALAGVPDGEVKAEGVLLSAGLLLGKVD